MTQTAECTVRDLVLQASETAEVFEKLGIDYFCRGNRSLREALTENGFSLEDFIRERDSAGRHTRGTAAPDWRTAPLRMLIRHIVEKHHNFLQRELAGLDQLITEPHPSEHVWLPALRQIFRSLKSDMEVHMRKEETILFPAIVDSEAAVAAGLRPQALPFGSVANFSRVLEQEHRRTARILHEIRLLTSNYICPPGASERLQALLCRLQIMVADVHLHIHLENNILFPHAIALEKGEPLCQR